MGNPIEREDPFCLEIYLQKVKKFTCVCLLSCFYSLRILAAGSVKRSGGRKLSLRMDVESGGDFFELSEALLNATATGPRDDNAPSTSNDRAALQHFPAYTPYAAGKSSLSEPLSPMSKCQQFSCFRRDHATVGKRISYRSSEHFSKEKYPEDSL